MNYSITVTYKGIHFFATAKRSITNETVLHVVYAELSKHFTKKLGYELLVTKWETTGYPVAPYKFLTKDF